MDRLGGHFSLPEFLSSCQDGWFERIPLGYKILPILGGKFANLFQCDHSLERLFGNKQQFVPQTIQFGGGMGIQHQTPIEPILSVKKYRRDNLIHRNNSCVTQSRGKQITNYGQGIFNSLLSRLIITTKDRARERNLRSWRTDANTNLGCALCAMPHIEHPHHRQLARGGECRRNPDFHRRRCLDYQMVRVNRMPQGMLSKTRIGFHFVHPGSIER